MCGLYVWMLASRATMCVWKTENNFQKSLFSLYCGFLGLYCGFLGSKSGNWACAIGAFICSAVLLICFLVFWNKDSLWDGRVVLLHLALCLIECVYCQRHLQCSFMLDFMCVALQINNIEWTVWWGFRGCMVCFEVHEFLWSLLWAP